MTTAINKLGDGHYSGSIHVKIDIFEQANLTSGELSGQLRAVSKGLRADLRLRDASEAFSCRRCVRRSFVLIRYLFLALGNRSGACRRTR
jgi:hypothetical protein